MPGLTPFRNFMGSLFEIIKAMCRKCLKKYGQYWVITAVPTRNLYMIAVQIAPKNTYNNGYSKL